MEPIKIIAARLANRDTRFLHGQSVQNGRLELLVDRRPKFIYRRVGAKFYMAECDGFFSLYEHQPGTTDGFAGSKFDLTMEWGEVCSFKGSLWDPWNVNYEGIPKHKGCSITDDPNVFRRGHTFWGGKILLTNYESIVADILARDQQRIIDPSKIVSCGISGIDYTDLVIFDFVAWAIDSHCYKRQTFDWKEDILWTRLTSRDILEKLPLLNCVERSISRRMIKLINAGMVARRPIRDIDGNYWISIGPKGNQYINACKTEGMRP